MDSRPPIDLHGHPSAAQRREAQLNIELLKTKILADHLRAVVCIVLDQHPKQCLVIAKETISQNLGRPLLSKEDPLMQTISFTAGEIVPRETEDVPPSTGGEKEPS